VGRLGGFRALEYDHRFWFGVFLRDGLPTRAPGRNHRAPVRGEVAWPPAYPGGARWGFPGPRCHLHVFLWLLFGRFFRVWGAPLRFVNGFLGGFLCTLITGGRGFSDEGSLLFAGACWH